MEELRSHLLLPGTPPQAPCPCLTRELLQTRQQPCRWLYLPPPDWEPWGQGFGRSAGWSLAVSITEPGTHDGVSNYVWSETFKSALQHRFHSSQPTSIKETNKTYQCSLRLPMLDDETGPPGEPGKAQTPCLWAATQRVGSAGQCGLSGPSWAGRFASHTGSQVLPVLASAYGDTSSLKLSPGLRSDHLAN